MKGSLALRQDHGQELSSGGWWGRSAQAGTMCTEPRRRLLALRGPWGGDRQGQPPDSRSRSLGGPFPKLAERLPPRARPWASRGRLGGAPWKQLSQPPRPAPLSGSRSWMCRPGPRACRVGNFIQNGCWNRLGFILSKCYQFLRPDKLNRSSDTVRGLGPPTSGP